jgi:hypothetical protein
VAFDWDGHDEMAELRGDGWAELQGDGSPVGEISFHIGGETPIEWSPAGRVRRRSPKIAASPRFTYEL